MSGTTLAGGISPTFDRLVAKIVVVDGKNNAAAAAATASALTVGITADGPGSDEFEAVVTPELQGDGSYLAAFSSSSSSSSPSLRLKLKAETTYWMRAKYTTQTVGSAVSVAVGVADTPSVVATRLAGGGVPSGVAVVVAPSLAAGVVADPSLAAVTAVAGVSEGFFVTLHDAAGNRVKAAGLFLFTQQHHIFAQLKV